MFPILMSNGIHTHAVDYDDFYCSYPIWYYDPSTPGYVWNGLEYNSAWSECQPYKATAGIYSPGICPSGQEFKQVFKAVNDDSYGNTATFWNGYCCTIEFNLEYATFTIGSSVSTNAYPFCISSIEPPLTANLPDDSGEFGKKTVLDSAVIAIAGQLQMLWQENDLSLFPESLAASLRVGMGLPAFPTTSTTATPTGTSTTRLPAPTSSDARSESSAAHLSKGAIAGISTSVAVIVLLIGTLAYLAFSRRWKNHGPKTEQQGRDSSTRNSNKVSHLSWIARWKKGTTLPDLPELDQGQNVYKHFSGGAWRAELHGTYSRNPSDGLQVDSRFSHYSESTAVVGAPMELEGSVPVRQETIPEVREDY